MRSVLFINRVYPPDEGATGQLLQELAENLTARGWSVTVVAAGAGGESGKRRSESGEPKAESGNGKADGVGGGVRVERVGGARFSKASHWRRALAYLSLYPAFVARVGRVPRPDVIVTLTDPPLHLALGPLLRWCTGSQLIHWAQDVYPEVAEELGVVRKGGMVASTLRRVSTWALRRCDRVVTVGSCMRERLIARGLDPARIAVIPNWALKTSFGEAQSGKEAGAAFRRERGWEGKFVVMYSGNLGLAHAFDAILAAARQMAGRSEVRFVFVGGGARLAALQASTAGLANVEFLPFQPLERLADSLAAADLHFATMETKLCGLVVPSKVYGILAAGRPCLFLGPPSSEASQLLQRSRAGIVLEPDDVAGIQEWLIRLAADPSSMRDLRANARAVWSEISGHRAAEMFEEVLGGESGERRVES